MEILNIKFKISIYLKLYKNSQICISQVDFIIGDQLAKNLGKSLRELKELIYLNLNLNHKNIQDIGIEYLA